MATAFGVMGVERIREKTDAAFRIVPAGERERDDMPIA